MKRRLPRKKDQLRARSPSNMAGEDAATESAVPTERGVNKAKEWTGHSKT